MSNNNLKSVKKKVSLGYEFLTLQGFTDLSPGFFREFLTRHGFTDLSLMIF